MAKSVGVTASQKKAEAFISVNKNRQKICEDNLIYFPDKTNFEIELFNPLSECVIAEIFINYEKLSRDIILSPGERLYLDRYTDVNRKFLFHVYNVNKNDKSVQDAITNNGKIRIVFHKEKKERDCCACGGIHILPLNPYPVYPSTPVTPLPWWWDPVVYTTETSTNTIGYVDSRTDAERSEVKSYTLTTASVDTSGNVSWSCDYGHSNKADETGRIIKGEQSEQKLEEHYSNFENTVLAEYEYVLMPVSLKPVTKDEVEKGILYCGNCGHKIKNKFKFCPQCGKKIKR